MIFSHGGLMKKLLLSIALLLLSVNICSAQTASLLPNGEQQFIDANGAPYAGGHVYFYVPTTTTLKNTWVDPYQVTPNSNPVVLDSAGRALIYGSGQYSEVLYDSSGNLVWNQLTSSTGITSTNQAVTSTGSPNAYVVTYTSVPTSYQVGGYYPFIANFTSTNTTPTENVNGLGAKTITKNGTSALAAGDICSGQVIVTVYDGTYLQMTNPPCNGVTISAVTSVAPDASGTITTTPNPITGTGTVGIASIANKTFLGNLTGSGAQPSAVGLSAFLDSLTGTAAQGNVLFRGASAWQQLAPGTSGYFLQTQGASANPQWAQTSAALTLLATVNASAASSVVFGSSYFTSSYNKYQIEFDGTYTSDGSTLELVASTNNGSTYLGTYANTQAISGSGCSLSGPPTSYLSIMGTGGTSTIGSSSSQTSSGTIKISNPSSSTSQGFSWQTVLNQPGSAVGMCIGAGMQFTSTSAINAVKFYDGSGGTITGNFHLYGITGL